MTDNENIKALDTLHNREVELLKKENERFADIGKMYSEVRAEVIKEFAERLCEGRVSNDPVVIAVKTELKMTEEKENG